MPRRASKKKPKEQPRYPRSSFWDDFFTTAGYELEAPEKFTPLECEILTEMLREGYKKLAMKYHPDHGGDSNRMRELNRIKAELKF